MNNCSKAELDKLFQVQTRAFEQDRNPDIDQRMAWLQALEAMMLEYRVPAQEAMTADFGSHPPRITDMFENGGVLGRARYIQAHLAEWMKADVRALNKDVHGSSSVEVIHQPKGVMGNISPWNFPIECSLVMACDMLAAGNRLIVKTSELAPHTGAMLQEAVAKFFPADTLTVVTGDADFGAYFSSLPWAHLTYTGSTKVGKLVAQAAAANLTPVTLELGGKNPTVFAKDGVVEQYVKEFLSFKFCKSGQICTSPDYVFVPEDQSGEWIALAKKVWSEAYPTYIGHEDVTGMISEAHYDRVLDLVDEAREAGCEVISLSEDSPDRNLRQIPMYLVMNPSDELKIMQEEIFGPVTAVKTYRTTNDVWDYINTKPHALASYLVSNDAATVTEFKSAILSGGAGVNVFGFQGAEPSVTFGGIGASGMGCHSGYEGFLNYSHAKSVFTCADDNIVKASVLAPYGDLMDQINAAVFTSAS